MWQQPMWHPGMPPPGAGSQMVRPTHDQTAASWAIRAQQWAQQRRANTGMYPSQSYLPAPPGEGPPLPPGVHADHPSPVPPPPPAPTHSTEARYYQYSSAPQNYEHEYMPPAPPPPPSHPPYPTQRTEQHPKSNPQTGQVESQFHPPPYPHHHPTRPPPPPPPHQQQYDQWDYTEPHSYSQLAPYPPPNYTPPSDNSPPPPPLPPTSPPPAPHHYSYSYVPTHRYQHPYGQDTPEEPDHLLPPQKDNEEIELAAKRLLEDESDSDSDCFSSHRSSHKRASEEDVLLTRRVYDPSHVYAQQPPPPAQAHRSPEVSPRSHSPPPVPLHPPVPPPPEQPPQSFDYGHGFPPPARFQAPSHPRPPYPFPSGAPDWAPPAAAAGSEFYPAVVAAGGEEVGSGGRRVIPAWLRDDLKKLEKDRQKQVGKDIYETGRDSGTSLRRRWIGNEESEMFGPPLPDHLLTTENRTSRLFTSDDARDKFLIEALQTTVTEFLLEVTSIEIDNVCSNALADARQLRAKPMVSYDSSSESSQLEEVNSGTGGRRGDRRLTPKQRREERDSSLSSQEGRHSERKHKQKTRSSGHHRRKDNSPSRSKRRSDKSRPYRSRSRSPASPHTKSVKKHTYRH